MHCQDADSVGNLFSQVRGRKDVGGNQEAEILGVNIFQPLLPSTDDASTATRQAAQGAILAKVQEASADAGIDASLALIPAHTTGTSFAAKFDQTTGDYEYTATADQSMRKLIHPVSILTRESEGLIVAQPSGPYGQPPSYRGLIPNPSPSQVEQNLGRY